MLGRLWCNLTRRCTALWQDRRGSYELIQLVLVLPVLVAILLGSYELVKMASVRQTLEAATYQAARYLSEYHRYYAGIEENTPRRNVDERIQAERLIWESLLANPNISQAGRVDLVVRYYNGEGQEMASPADFRCNKLGEYVTSPGALQAYRSGFIFTVRTWVTIPWKASVLGLSLGQVTLSSAHTTFVDCQPWYPPRATPTPGPTPSPTP
jgi:Flp pilus assembly protein TadG